MKTVIDMSGWGKVWLTIVAIDHDFAACECPVTVVARFIPRLSVVVMAGLRGGGPDSRKRYRCRACGVEWAQQREAFRKRAWPVGFHEIAPVKTHVSGRVAAWRAVRKPVRACRAESRRR